MKLRELPLIALRTFAVVADSGSITAAAETLGVTHSAVSKQVKNLERWLGQPLFTLDGKKLILTPFGDILSQKLNSAFEEITGACAYVHRHREKRIITIEAPATFAMYWLMPRVASFRQARQADVWISTRVTGQSPNFSENDLVILRGETTPTSIRLRTRVLLFHEDLTVVTSPTLHLRYPLETPADVLSHPMLETATRPLDWQLWLSKAEVKSPVITGGHRFDHLFVAIQAVKDGFGTTVAPRKIFGHAISAGDFICPFPEITTKGAPYYAYFTEDTLDPVLRSFQEWLKREVADSH